MAITMPLYGILMLTLVLANASIPLSCNFIGEFISLLAAFEYSSDIVGTCVVVQVNKKHSL